MKPILPAVVLVVIIALIFSVSVSTPHFSSLVWVRSGSDEEARRQELLSFIATHDWRGELKRVGIELPTKTYDQIVAVLNSRGEPLDSSTSIQFVFRLSHTGLTFVASKRDEAQRAVALIEARSKFQAILIDSAAVEDPAVRRQLIWDLYTWGFDDDLRTALAARTPEESDPETKALCELILEKLQP